MKRCWLSKESDRYEVPKLYVEYDAYRIGAGISLLYISAKAQKLPLLPYMFGVYPRGITQIRPL